MGIYGVSRSGDLSVIVYKGYNWYSVINLKSKLIYNYRFFILSIRTRWEEFVQSKEVCKYRPGEQTNLYTGINEQK